MQELLDFVKSYPIKTFEAKDIILHQGDKVSCAYFILKGKVKVFDINKDGEEKSLSYDKKLEMFPISWLFLNTRRSQFYYEAYTKCTIAIIPKRDYLAFIKSNNNAMFATLKTLVVRQSDLTRRVNGLAQLKAEDKVLHALKYLSRKHAKKSNTSTISLNMPIPQHELANFVGLTRETVSAVINKLKKKNIIIYSGNKQIKVDKQKIDENIEM